MKLSPEWVATYRKRASEDTIFGEKLEDLDREELLSVIGYLSMNVEELLVRLVKEFLHEVQAARGVERRIIVIEDLLSKLKESAK